MISVAAGGVYHQENYQEDEYDDANYSSFGQAAFDYRERREIKDDLTKSIANIISVASNMFFVSTHTSKLGLHFLANRLKNMVRGVGGCIPGSSPMVKLKMAGSEVPLALIAVTSSS